MRFLIIFTLFISNTLASETSNIENLVVNKELKTYDNIIFLDSQKKIVKQSHATQPTLPQGKLFGTLPDHPTTLPMISTSLLTFPWSP